MFLNIFYIIFILSTFTLYSSGQEITDLNDRELLLAIKLDSQFIRAEIERLKKAYLDNERENESLRTELQVHKADSQRLREDQHLLELTIRSQVLTEELEQQKRVVIKKDADLKESEKNVKEMENFFMDTENNCDEAKFRGVHDILIPNFSWQPFKAMCEVETLGGGWTIILSRMGDSLNFTRSWTEYKNGFGHLKNEYFLGLDRIHAMTAEKPHELWVSQNVFKEYKTIEIYDDFAIGGEDQQYVLHTLGKANGTAEDTFTSHRGMKFTTFDKDNDEWDGGNCAVRRAGGWWYRNCDYGHLMDTQDDAVVFMMIRPKK